MDVSKFQTNCFSVVSKVQQFKEKKKKWNKELTV